MELVKDFPTQVYPPTAVTIGNFDGCHRGHQLLLATTVRLARSHAQRSVVLSFADGVQLPGAPPVERLFTAAQKLRSFTESGLDVCLLPKFQAVSSISHQEFLQDRLRGHLNMQQLVIGTDFRFGYQRRGNAAWLQQQQGFELTTIAPLKQGGQRISSSAIRELLAQGNVEVAAQMLGRAYMLEGKVQRGQQRGRELGAPTANLGAVTQLLPADGVYAGWTVLAETSSVLTLPTDRLPSVINIGTRPTVTRNGARTIETHIIGTKLGETYDRKIFVFFVKRLRAEQQFPDLAALRARIKLDIAEAQHVLVKE